MDRMSLNLAWKKEIFKSYSNVNNTIQYRSIMFNTGCKTCTLRSTVDVIVEFNAIMGLIDLSALLPDYMHLIMVAIDPTLVNRSSTKIITILKITTILRIFRLERSMRPMMDRMYLNLSWIKAILKTYSNVKNTIQHRSMMFNTGCTTCILRSTVEVIVELRSALSIFFSLIL
jgi:hypothetical protein